MIAGNAAHSAALQIPPILSRPVRRDHRAPFLQRRRSRRTRQRAQPNPPLFDNREMSGPIGARMEQGHSDASDLFGGRLRDAKQDDAAGGGQARSVSQLAEILVEGEQDSGFCLGASEDCPIGNARRIDPNPGHIVAVFPQGGDGGERKILVGEQAHRLSSEFQREYALCMEDCAGVAETSSEIFGRQPRIVAQDLVLGPAFRQQIDEKFDRESSAPDHRLPSQDVRIENDPLLPIRARFTHRTNLRAPRSSLNTIRCRP